MSQAFLYQVYHYYAGDIKAKKLFYIGLGGFVCITVGALSFRNAEWLKTKIIILFKIWVKEMKGGLVPTSVHISESGEELIHYNLKEIQKESVGRGGFLMLAGIAIILGDLVYDRIVGLRLIEQKRDKVRFKYGQNLNFTFHPRISPMKNGIGLSLKFNFG